MADIDEAFAAGRQAAIDGNRADANPHPPGSPECEQWQKGFEFVDTFGEDGEIPTDN